MILCKRGKKWCWLNLKKKKSENVRFRICKKNAENVRPTFSVFFKKSVFRFYF